jgi:hypothetical protein
MRAIREFSLFRTFLLAMRKNSAMFSSLPAGSAKTKQTKPNQLTMKIKHQYNWVAEEATLIGETLAETRAISACGGGEFIGGGALASARTQAALATSWMARHPEASATSRPRPNRARPLNQLAQQILRRGGHIADVRHMVTYI